MQRRIIRNPINIRIPRLKIGGTIGGVIGKVTNAVDDIGVKVIHYNVNIFEDLNDESKKLVNDFEECVAKLGGMSKDELATKLAKRVLSKLTPDVNQDQFNNIFKDEAVALYSEVYSAPTVGTCLLFVGGMMIAAAAIIATYVPEITLFEKGLIAEGFALAASGCKKFS